MAGSDGQKNDSLKEHLLDVLEANPFRFDFFRALRLLESKYSDRPRIGSTHSPAQDGIRLGQSNRMNFATSTLDAMEYGMPGRPPKLSVNFMGLLGPNGPMPLYLTEFIRDRRRHVRDTTLSAFLDVFHHRMLCFFYRAWAINQKAVDYDRPDEAHFARYVSNFYGTGRSSLQDEDTIPENAKRYYAGRLGSQARNADGLEAILGDFFEVPASIEALIGHWLPLPANDLCRLGLSPATASLGLTSIVGRHVWDVQNRFRIRFGPVKLERYVSFLPTGASFKRLFDWVSFYTNFQFNWEVQLVLEADEVPQIQLGGAGLLGWTTWLKSEPFTADAADLIIDRSQTKTETTYYEP